MGTYNNISFQDVKNLNLKGGAQGFGLIRFSPGANGVTNAGGFTTSPFSSTDYGLYINSSNQLVFSALGSTTTLGAAGAGGGTPSWDAIYAGDQKLAISGTTLTFDGTHATNNVFTVTDSAAGSGNLIQITNTGTGKDIAGTSDTWDFSAAGAMTALTAVFAGTADTDSITLTQGNLKVSDGTFTVVDDTNGGSFVFTNATVSTGVNSTWTLNGLTSGGGLLITSTGTIATTGYLLTLTANSATTAAGLLRLNANGLTSGIGVVISSSATAITGAGRLLRVDHTGATGTSAILSEFASAATDETVILKVTASGALALGKAFVVSGSGITTGNAIDASDLDSLTTGIGLSIASAATAITGAGRLVYVNHTGATGTSATLVEFASAATDETIIFQVTASAALALGSAFVVSAASMTTGTGINVIGTAITSGKGITVTGLDALTSGIGLQVTSAATAITGAGRLFFSNHTGATGTSATLNEFKSSANDETIVLGVSAASLTSGTLLVLTPTALTTGKGISVTDLAALTSGIGVNITSASTALTGAGRLLFVNHSGASSSSGTVAEIKSAATDGTTVLTVTAGAGTGSAVNVVHSGAVASGVGAVHIASSGATAAGAAVLLVKQTGTPAGATSYLALFDNTGMTATNNPVGVLISQIGTAAALSVTSSGATAAGAGTLTVAQTGTPTSTGYVAKFDNSGITATNNPPAVFINQKGTGAALSVTAVVQTTHFYKIATMNGVTLWMGDGNTGNAALSGTAGDILFNGGSNKPEYCTGTTNWTALV